MPGYLHSEQLLFLSPWRPVESDTTPHEGVYWDCPTCMEERLYFRALSRMEGAERQFMVQCPTCDHLAVVRFIEGEAGPTTEFGGPHIDRFIAFLDARNRREEFDL